MAEKLILTRKSNFLNRSQQFKVVINGTEKGIIKKGESLEFELEPGIHSVSCKYNWMSSNEKTFEINEGKNTYLSVGSGMKLFLPLYILMIALLLLPLVMKFADAPVPEELQTAKLVVILVVLLYMVLYWTVLKNKYLLIEDDKTNPFNT